MFANGSAKWKRPSAFSPLARFRVQRGPLLGLKKEEDGQNVPPWTEKKSFAIIRYSQNCTKINMFPDIFLKSYQSVVSSHGSVFVSVSSPLLFALS